MQTATTILLAGSLLAAIPIAVAYGPSLVKEQRIIAGLSLLLATIGLISWRQKPALYLLENSFLVSPTSLHERVLKYSEGLTEIVAVTEHEKEPFFRRLWTSGHSMS